MSEYKKFSQELCNENDQVAKEVAVDFLEWTGHYKLEVPLDEQEEQFKKQDFEVVLISKDRKVSIEVERKKVWTKECAWQGWPTIDVPSRKSESASDLFIMVNKECNTIAVTTMKNVLTSKVSAKKTIYTDSEDFFNVELGKFNFYCKSEGSWKKI
jgi:hypothetical protein